MLAAARKLTRRARRPTRASVSGVLQSSGPSLRRSADHRHFDGKEIRARGSLRDRALPIGFGFAIVQFFERLQQMPGLAPASFPRAPQYLGLALISCGVLALLVSIWEYRWTIRYMWAEPFEQVAGMRSGVSREQMHSPVMAIAALLVFIGLFAFFAVLLRQV